MSFILDALKKSEEQRQKQAASPAVKRRSLTVRWHRQSASGGRLLLALLVISVIIVGFYLLTDGTGRQSDFAALQQNATTQDSGSALPTAPAQARNREPGVEGDPKALTTTPSPVPLPLGMSPRTAGDTFGGAPLSPSTSATGVIQRPEPSGAPGVRASGHRSSPPHFDTLPADVRERIPEIVLSLHFYSDDPARSLARINGRMHREGDLIAPGLQLVQILPDGLLFDDRGQRFFFD